MIKNAAQVMVCERAILGAGIAQSLQGLPYGLNVREIRRSFSVLRNVQTGCRAHFPPIKLLHGVFILGETNLPPFSSEFGMSGAVLSIHCPRFLHGVQRRSF